MRQHYHWQSYLKSTEMLLMHEQMNLLTRGHEGRFDGRGRPVGMSSLDIGSRTASVRARHGCARDYVETDTPGIFRVEGRRCDRRPRCKNVHSRCCNVRLYIIDLKISVHDLKQFNINQCFELKPFILLTP